jgi:hypothetical protein
MTEQRNYQRINFYTETDIRIGNKEYRCDLVDLALQGALFRSEQELPIVLGDQVSLSIYLPDSAVQMKFVGELIHRQRNFYGFIFVSEEAESLGHLRRLLELNFGDAERAEEEFLTWLKRNSAR